MTTTLPHTPLYDTHVALTARMVPFAGWEMPVQYPPGILAEARAVRTHAGLFDVSHMGRIMVEGADAQPLLNWVHSADIGPEMPVGRARYGLLCNEEGGIIDDGIVYRLGPERFLLVANAANMPQVLEWLSHWQRRRFPQANLDNATERMAMIALQGPDAMDIIARIAEGFDPAKLRPFRCLEGTVQSRPALMARTGYTGEDGLELMPKSEDAAWLWRLLMDQGARPCGLGARDVLRLEAGLLLHGNDMDAATSPLEAGLERFLALDKEDFCGAQAIRRLQASGPTRRLVGFQTPSRGVIPRPHAPLLAGDEVVGQVTSGGYSPTLDRSIGLGYVPLRFSSPGEALRVDVRGRPIDAEVVALPFYSRSR